jgi:hypothetical protein
MNTCLMLPDHPSLHCLNLHAPPLSSPALPRMSEAHEDPSHPSRPPFLTSPHPSCSSSSLALHPPPPPDIYPNSSIRVQNSFIRGRFPPRSSASHNISPLHQRSAGLYLCSSAFIWGCNKTYSCRAHQQYIPIMNTLKRGDCFFAPLIAVTSGGRISDFRSFQRSQCFELFFPLFRETNTTSNVQPSTSNLQPSTFNLQRLTL